MPLREWRVQMRVTPHVPGTMTTTTITRNLNYEWPWADGEMNSLGRWNGMVAQLIRIQLACVCWGSGRSQLHVYYLHTYERMGILISSKTNKGTVD